jgi:hypothetical protein
MKNAVRNVQTLASRMVVGVPYIVYEPMCVMVGRCLLYCCLLDSLTGVRETLSLLQTVTLSVGHLIVVTPIVTS